MRRVTFLCVSLFFLCGQLAEDPYQATAATDSESPRPVVVTARLAESRRREFRRRPLAEFSLTLPVTNIPTDAPALRLRADGTVQAV